MSDTSAFRTTLLRWAETDDPVERRRVAGLLASQIELALNQQGNNAQVVIWDVEQKTEKKIDDLHEQVGNTNTLISSVIVAVNGLRGAVERSVASVSESTARLGKLEDQYSAIDDRVAASEDRLDRKRVRLDTLEKRMERIEQRLEEIEEARGVVTRGGDGNV